MNNTLQEEGVSMSKSTIKRRLHESKYRRFTAQCKPLISLMNRKARLDFAKTNFKKHQLSSGRTFFGQMKPRSTSTRMMVKSMAKAWYSS